MMPTHSCPHLELQTEPAPPLTAPTYKRASSLQRAAAATRHGQVKRVQGNLEKVDPWTFPGPLVLPDDDLAWDPSWPKQSVRAWVNEKERNPVSTERDTLYVLACPRISAEVDFMKSWAAPTGDNPARQRLGAASMVNDVVEYLAAFYHGITTRKVEIPLEFVPWDESKKRKRQRNEKPEMVGLRTASECIGIRTRECPDQSFKRQLSVNDLIDVLISVLPGDAYSILLLVDYDIYETDDDDFLCGRAYGGSRVAVVSTARYDPFFDGSLKIDPHHVWPASHCSSFIHREVLRSSKDSRSYLPNEKASSKDVPQKSPLRLAVTALQQTSQELYDSSKLKSTDAVDGVWLSRVCRTASHELGHCFGLDHCVYYACNMQGTAELAEDYRQPPYLCPVDLAKVLLATSADQISRYRALLTVCNKHKHVPMFAAYSAWLKAHLLDLNAVAES